MSTSSAPIALRRDPAPHAPLLALETVWFQVTGTICNLRCAHCFISCGPTNRSLEFMDRARIREFVAEAVTLGAKDYYFTGGEPFLHPEMTGILEDTLAAGPATVLTNATIVAGARAGALGALAAAARHPLEIRVSLDGPTPGENDAIRGEGSFDAALRGIRALAGAGIDPILTAVRTWADGEDAARREAFERLLLGCGCARARVKILPAFRLGAEERRTHGYDAGAIVTQACLTDFDLRKLQCTTSRMVTSRGVYVCPLLVEAADARLGATLRESLRPYALAHGACHTCRVTGATCRN
jgi:uncharacterized Fe-S cluster-containing radical SAM superfamily protein